MGVWRCKTGLSRWKQKSKEEERMKKKEQIKKEEKRLSGGLHFKPFQYVIFKIYCFIFEIKQEKVPVLVFLRDRFHIKNKGTKRSCLNQALASNRVLL